MAQATRARAAISSTLANIRSERYSERAFVSRPMARTVVAKQRLPLSAKLDESRRDPPMFQLEDDHRPRISSALLRRAAGVEDPDRAVRREFGYMRVAVDDCLAVGEAGDEPVPPTGSR